MALAQLLQPAALLPTGRCHINFFPVKNPPRCYVFSHQNSLTTPLLCYD